MPNFQKIAQQKEKGRISIRPSLPLRSGKLPEERNKFHALIS